MTTESRSANGAMKVIAVIPARGGSKGLSRKNIRIVAGQPLLNWTVRAAKAARRVSRVLVTTDDAEIASVAIECGAEAPFLRPAELARDETLQCPPIEHALDWLAKNENYHPDVVVMLQPTSPLRTAADIDAALVVLESRQADAVLSVTPVKHHPYWTKQVDEVGRLVPFLPSAPAILRRQDLPAAFALNGAIYCIKVPVLLERHTFFPENLFPYVMPPERSHDIDSLGDLRIAELFLMQTEASH